MKWVLRCGILEVRKSNHQALRRVRIWPLEGMPCVEAEIGLEDFGAYARLQEFLCLSCLVFILTLYTNSVREGIFLN